MRPTREEYSKVINKGASDIGRYIGNDDSMANVAALMMADIIRKKYLSDPNSVESPETIPDTMKILTAKGKTIELDLIEIKYPTHSDRERQENDMRSYYRGDRDGAELFYRENNVSE